MDSRTPSHDADAIAGLQFQYDPDLDGPGVSGDPLEDRGEDNQHFDAYRQIAGVSHAADCVASTAEMSLALHALHSQVESQVALYQADQLAKVARQLPVLQLMLAPADPAETSPLRVQVPLDALPPAILPHLLVLTAAICDLYDERFQQEWHRVVDQVNSVSIFPQRPD